MQYIDPRFVRVANLTTVEPLGVLFASGSGKEVILSFADQVVFLVGGVEGEAFPREKGGYWDGMAVEGLSIEVDFTSEYEVIGPMYLLSVIRHKDSINLNVRVKPTGGFPSNVRIPLVGGLPKGLDDKSAAFTRWRLTLGSGAEKIVVYEVNADPVKNASQT